MQEEFRPLEIAFMCWNLNIANYLLGRFADDNPEQIAQRRRDRLILTDGTTITPLTPGRVRSGIDGRRFDQLILADDRRELLREEAADEIEAVLYGSMCFSCVPEEYQVLFYNIDAPAPCRECGRPVEILHHETGKAGGAVSLCRECHERAHMGAEGISTPELLETVATIGRAFARAGIGADEAAEAFRRAAELARSAIDPETEIAAIRANSSLSRFQKWRIIRKIKRRTP